MLLPRESTRAHQLLTDVATLGEIDRPVDDPGRSRDGVVVELRPHRRQRGADPQHVEQGGGPFGHAVGNGRSGPRGGVDGEEIDTVEAGPGQIDGHGVAVVAIAAMAVIAGGDSRRDGVGPGAPQRNHLDGEAVDRRVDPQLEPLEPGLGRLAVAALDIEPELVLAPTMEPTPGIDLALRLQQQRSSGGPDRQAGHVLAELAVQVLPGVGSGNDEEITDGTDGDHVGGRQLFGRFEFDHASSLPRDRRRMRRRHR